MFRRKPSPKQLMQAYNDGLPGAPVDHAGRDQLMEDRLVGEYRSAAGRINGLHKHRRRVLLYKALRRLDPPTSRSNQGAYASESQTAPDCTSHGSRWGVDTTRANEIVHDKTGERWVARGSTEHIYSGRGHGGGGMSPEKATRILGNGQLLRLDYRDEGGPDLRVYDSRKGERNGRTGIPRVWGEIAETELRAHKWFHARRTEEALDYMAAGYGGHAGSQFGSSQRTGADGLNLKTKSWNHDMAHVGFDLTCEFWRVAVVFIANSWGAWNLPNPVWRANEDVFGPWIPGMLVVPLELFARHIIRAGSAYYFAQVDGDAIKPLPLTEEDFGGWNTPMGVAA